MALPAFPRPRFDDAAGRRNFGYLGPMPDQIEQRCVRYASQHRCCAISDLHAAERRITASFQRVLWVCVLWCPQGSRCVTSAYRCEGRGLRNFFFLKKEKEGRYNARPKTFSTQMKSRAGSWVQ